MCRISRYFIINDMSSDKILPTLVITHDGYEQLCPLIKGKLIMPPKKNYSRVCLQPSGVHSARKYNMKIIKHDAYFFLGCLL